MKLHQTIEVYWNIIGITKLQSTQKYPFLHWRILLSSLVLASSIIFGCVYIIHVADTFAEYVDSISMVVTSTVVAIGFMSVNVFHMKKLFFTREYIEDLIDKSKRKFV